MTDMSETDPTASAFSDAVAPGISTHSVVADAVDSTCDVPSVTDAPVTNATELDAGRQAAEDYKGAEITSSPSQFDYDGDIDIVPDAGCAFYQEQSNNAVVEGAVITSSPSQFDYDGDFDIVPDAGCALQGLGSEQQDAEAKVGQLEGHIENVVEDQDEVNEEEEEDEEEEDDEEDAEDEDGQKDGGQEAGRSPAVSGEGSDKIGVGALPDRNLDAEGLGLYIADGEEAFGPIHEESRARNSRRGHGADVMMNQPNHSLMPSLPRARRRSKANSHTRGSKKSNEGADSEVAILLITFSKCTAAATDARKKKCYKKALEHLGRGLSIASTAGNSDNPTVAMETARMRLNYSSTLSVMGRHDEALDEIELALAGVDDVLTWVEACGESKLSLILGIATEAKALHCASLLAKSMEERFLRPQAGAPQRAVKEVVGIADASLPSSHPMAAYARRLRAGKGLTSVNRSEPSSPSGKNGMLPPLCTVAVREGAKPHVCSYDHGGRSPGARSPVDRDSLPKVECFRRVAPLPPANVDPETISARSGSSSRASLIQPPQSSGFDKRDSCNADASDVIEPSNFSLPREGPAAANALEVDQFSALLSEHLSRDSLASKESQRINRAAPSSRSPSRDSKGSLQVPSKRNSRAPTASGVPVSRSRNVAALSKMQGKRKDANVFAEYVREAKQKSGSRRGVLDEEYQRDLQKKLARGIKAYNYTHPPPADFEELYNTNLFCSNHGHALQMKVLTKNTSVSRSAPLLSHVKGMNGHINDSHRLLGERIPDVVDILREGAADSPAKRKNKVQ